MGSPVGTAAIAATNCSMNSSARSRTTMKRLEAMQDCPLFWMRAVTASGTVASMSAELATMNGSEPPNSSTDFFRCWPAISATERPARSEPVSVTAAMRGSAMMRGIWS